MFEDINTPEEFTPLSQEQADFIAQLAVDVRAVAAELPEGHRQILEVASSNLLRLTAMSMAGFHLFHTWSKMADILHADLGTSMTMLEKYAPDSTKLLRTGAYSKYNHLAEEVVEEVQRNENGNY